PARRAARPAARRPRCGQPPPRARRGPLDLTQPAGHPPPVRNTTPSSTTDERRPPTADPHRWPHPCGDPMQLRRALTVTAVTAATALLLGACAAGEGSPVTDSGGEAVSDSGWSKDTVNIDFATYSPLSLIIKEFGWIEATLGDDVQVNWIQSAG